jgi:hypothetical protein
VQFSLSNVDLPPAFRRLAGARSICFQQDVRLEQSPRRAFPVGVSNCCRSSPLSRTTYFFTEISFAAIVASNANSGDDRGS